MGEAAQLRIGELARRTGVATELLRAWERRYGLLTPDAHRRRLPALLGATTSSGCGRMRELLATGVSAAEAARQALLRAAALAEAAPAGGCRGRAARRALERLDDAAAHAAFDRLLADYSTRAVLDGVVLPLLRELGEGWERGEVSSRRSTSPRTSCAVGCSASRAAGTAAAGRARCSRCPPGERHDLGL